MRTETMLFAKDVEATSKWYQDFLGVQSGHGGPEYEMLMDGKTLLLQLHQLAADHDHGVGTAPPFGHGVLVYVHVDDAQAAYARAGELGIEILAGAYGCECARRWCRLTELVSPPACRSAVGAQSAGMRTADAYGCECTRRWCRD